MVRVVERNGRRPVYEFCLFLHRAALAPVHVLGGGDVKGPNFGPDRPFVDLVTDSRETNDLLDSSFSSIWMEKWGK